MSLISTVYNNNYDDNNKNNNMQFPPLVTSRGPRNQHSLFGILLVLDYGS